MQERDQAIAVRRPPAGGLAAGIAANPHAGLSPATRAAASAAVASAASGQGDFSQALAQARPVGSAVRAVVAGDTLTSMVKDHAQALGLPLSNAQAHRWVQQIAQDNKIANVNRIFPGQQIVLGTVPNDVAALTPTAPPPSVNKPLPAASRHEVLDRTLDRAVAKGFIPRNERGDVRDKILSLAAEHRFNPDDFARMTLMESDGMNPRATNQRCHGIIQFCGGPDRGAASAGYAANPQAILGLSVYQQLHLVDRYFDDVGLKNKGPAGLDDLYLSVLMPSARNETRSDAPLNVSGPQARYLYEGRDSRGPMTRQSILQGLLQNAAERLGPASSSPNSPNASNASNPLSGPAGPSAKGRLQALRTAAYEDAQPPGRVLTQLR